MRLPQRKGIVDVGRPLFLRFEEFVLWSELFLASTVPSPFNVYAPRTLLSNPVGLWTSPSFRALREPHGLLPLVSNLFTVNPCSPTLVSTTSAPAESLPFS